MLPWVVLSQTVPLIAIAPLVRRWGAQIEFGAFELGGLDVGRGDRGYLAFFPVVDRGAARALKSPDATHLDLMRTYGVGWWRTLVTLRLPASVPYLLPALRLAAANAVDRHGGRRGVDRAARRDRPIDHRVRASGSRRPRQAVGADLRRHPDRAGRRRRRRADRRPAAPLPPHGGDA